MCAYILGNNDCGNTLFGGSNMNRKQILEAADKCINGHREEDYGSPEDNFSIISKLWSAYKGVEFTSVDVALMLALLKIARARSGKGTDDCFVDLAGYAACAGEIFGKDRATVNIGENHSDLSNTFIKLYDTTPIPTIYRETTTATSTSGTRTKENIPSYIQGSVEVGKK